MRHRQIAAVTMGLAGFALSGAISAGWYLSTPHYEHPMSAADQLELQEHFPGGAMRGRYEYWRCERRTYPDGVYPVWVIYKPSHDVDVTGRTCW